MRLTGHSSRDIHQRYTHINVGELQKAIDAIPSRPQLPPSSRAPGTRRGTPMCSFNIFVTRSYP